jgi:hypothetical protein
VEAVPRYFQHQHAGKEITAGIASDWPWRSSVCFPGIATSL